jgi:Domain of Unknown Function (DUF1080)
MIYKSIKVFVFLICISALLSACSLGGGGGAGQPVATIKPAEVLQDTPTPSSVGEYFQEDFNGDLSSWSQFVVNTSKIAKGGNAVLADGPFGKMTVGVSDGFLTFDLESIGQRAYTIYDPQTYDDIHMDVIAENRGTNDNSVGLICRYDPAEGWYEFNVSNSGLYNILYATVKPDKTVVYTRLANGGYNKIKTGKDTNQYGITCQGKTLTLTINSYDVKTYDDNQYVLKKGKIGLSVSSSLSAVNLPAKVGFDSVKLSKP